MASMRMISQDFDGPVGMPRSTCLLLVRGADCVSVPHPATHPRTHAGTHAPHAGTGRSTNGQPPLSRLLSQSPRLAADLLCFHTDPWKSEGKQEKKKVSFGTSSW